MPQALDPSSYAYQGFWTNWSKGSVTGGTLTLTPSNATVLTAVLAIFVQISGSQLWNVIQLMLHHHRASKKPNDGFYHQQQAILRNSTSDIGTMRQLLRVAWAWRDKAKQPWIRSISLMLWASFHFSLFVLAGIFSSQLVDAGDETLSRSPYCGTFNNTYIDSLGSYQSTGAPNSLDIEFQAYLATRRQLSQEYVQSCYGDAKPSAYCGTFKQQQLSWTSNLTEPCPFHTSVCLPAAPTVTYDTGYIDSQRDLGINSPLQARLLYRRITQCTILDDSKYISDWKNVSSSNGTPKRVVDAYYGPNVLADRNATFSFSDSSDYYSWDQLSEESSYQLQSEFAIAGDALNSSFSPIPELVRLDADVVLAFLSFSKSYGSPVDDLWFSAHQASIYPSRDPTATNSTIYMRDGPVTTLACAEQHQFCSTNNEQAGVPKNCTPKMGYEQIDQDSRGIASLNLTPYQSAIYNRIVQAAVDSNIYNLLFYLSLRDLPLLARRMILKFVGTALPSNQWQVETNYWHQLAMAQLQRSTVEYGTGQFAPSTDDIALANTTEENWLCQNLVVRGTSFRSFALFPVILIVVIGLLIVLFGMSVENAAAVCLQKWNLGATGQEMWGRNSFFALQRLLYEEVGVGPWKDAANGIPITENLEEMMMDIEEEKRKLAEKQKKQQHFNIQSKEMGQDLLVGLDLGHAAAAAKRISGILLYDSTGRTSWVEEAYERLRGVQYPERLSYLNSEG